MATELGQRGHVWYILRPADSWSFARKYRSDAVSIDGAYGFVYCGVADLGIGAFIVENGAIRGIDYGGVSYSGSVQENPDGSITTKITFRVPAGGMLVQGVSPQDIPYDKVIEQTFPPLFGDGKPVPASTPPVTVMIRRLPPGSGLLAALGLK
jgi:hypothetical protein